MAGKARRKGTEGARKERAGCPEWADDKVSNFAQLQAASIQQSLAAHCGASTYAIASVGANLLALSLMTYHRDTCVDPNCESCKARGGVDPREAAATVLEYYFRRVELDMMPAEGNA